MKFWVDIIKRIMKIIFDNKIKINILFYFIILTLKLVVRLSIIIIMKGVNNKLLYIIDYILEVFIWIEDVIIYQSFFILKHEIN